MSNKLSPAVSDYDKAWVQGFACALSTLLKITRTRDANSDELFLVGCRSIRNLIKHGCDDYDLMEIKKYYKKMMTKLSPVQKAIIWILQNVGCIVLCDSGNKVHCNYAISKTEWVDFWINYNTFYNLVNYGIIYQQFQYHFDYILTSEGNKIKTPIPNLMKLFKNARHVTK